ncbi:hypothetical protein F5Y17DRAFT_22565 [Xylariaceae sp. FL0594]|nr:hypothetical protein F5Y17DRAFT_22565 [Xylariaceae sp. FL0594]
MESLSSTRNQPPADHEPLHPVLFNGFNWLEDNDDLDLRLTLKEDHADPKPPQTTTNTRPPSLFRRRLSTNKIPFSRGSVSSSRPATKDSTSPDPTPHVVLHTRRKSRALSLITPRLINTPKSLATPIDPDAAHYQDPEARHTLRSYLASPQKFDEALQYGFPSHNANNGNRPTILPGGETRRSRSFSRDLYIASSEKLRTFLADDNSSTHSRESSVTDGDSPRTPHTPEGILQGVKPFQLPSEVTTLSSKPSGNYGDDTPICREMTLRMTLTRPDLRHNDSYTLGKGIMPRQASLSSQSRSFRTVTPVSISDPKESRQEHLGRMFADFDRENHSSSEGMVKRLWKRVRRM